MVNITYRETDQTEIDAIEPLWGMLIDHMRLRSTDFRGHYETITFERRRTELLRKAAKGLLHICLARDADTGKFIGYCVSTLVKDGEETEGEIDSLFVDGSYRSLGIGDSLMKKALAWMDARGATVKKVNVGAGNEGVFKFYERFGFYSRMTVLRQIKK